MPSVLTQATPGETSASANSVSKVLNADAQRFSQQCQEKWSQGVTKETERLGLPSEGPGDVLGMDLIIQCEIDRLAKMDDSELLCNAVVSRETFVGKILG